MPLVGQERVMKPDRADVELRKFKKLFIRALNQACLEAIYNMRRQIQTKTRG